MMIAGEVSGDIHGARLIHFLRKKNKNIDFYGIGGSRMKREKFRTLCPLESLQSHGLFELTISYSFSIPEFISESCFLKIPNAHQS